MPTRLRDTINHRLIALVVLYACIMGIVWGAVEETGLTDAKMMSLFVFTVLFTVICMLLAVVNYYGSRLIDSSNEKLLEDLQMRS